MTNRQFDVGGAVVVVRELTGAADGPTVALLGGVHGDELEGIAAVRSVVATLTGHAPMSTAGTASQAGFARRDWGHSESKSALGAVTQAQDANPVARDARKVVRGGWSGRVLAVAVANPPAHAAGTRTSPADDGNLARLFPGRADGTLTERIADVLTQQVIRRADLLIDMHSAGLDYAMPFFAGFADPAGSTAAHAFGAPLVWAHDQLNPGRSLTAAASFGVASIYVEGGGGGALRRSELLGYHDGVLRVLGILGMLPATGASTSGSPTSGSSTSGSAASGSAADGGVRTSAAAPELPVTQRILRGGDGDVDSSVAATVRGWCVTAVRAGDQVRRGELVAEIIGAEGVAVEQILAPHDGTVMMLRRRAEVEPGHGIVMLGPIAEVVS